MVLNVIIRSLLKRRQLCDKNNLLVSGGSDFHGAKRKGVHIGTGYGKLLVDENRCNKWTDKIEDFR